MSSSEGLLSEGGDQGHRILGQDQRIGDDQRGNDKRGSDQRGRDQPGEGATPPPSLPLPIVSPIFGSIYTPLLSKKKRYYPPSF